MDLALEEMPENSTALIVEMAGETFSVLSVLSITAIFTTISLFFCGIPICIEIWRRRSTSEISGFPFIMGFLGGSFWLRYGVLKADMTMITVNAVGVTLMFFYIVYFTYFCEYKTPMLLQLAVVFVTIGSMLILIEIFGLDGVDVLGLVCMTFNIVNFGAPLAGMKVVIKKKCCDSMPLPLCTANLLVSSQWCLYGTLVHDIYIIIPNGAGVMLALFQMSLFLLFPRVVGGKAPLSSCMNALDELDIVEKPDGSESCQNVFDISRGGFKQSSLPASCRHHYLARSPSRASDTNTTVFTISMASSHMPSGRDAQTVDPELDSMFGLSQRSLSAPHIPPIAAEDCTKDVL